MIGLLRANGSGSWHRYVAVLVAVVGLTNAVEQAQAQDKKQSKAEKMLEKSIEARGGRAAFEKFENCVFKGTIELVVGEQRVEGTIERYEAKPSKTYTVIDFEGAKIQSGSNGKIHWRYHPMYGASISEGEEAAVDARRYRFNSFLYWREYFPVVEYAGKEDVDGRSCYKIVMTPDVGPPVTTYLDAKKGVPLKIETTRKDDEGNELAVESRIVDYMRVSGVLVASKTTTTLPSINRTITTTWESIEYDAKIPKLRFLLPNDVNELVKEAKRKAKKKEAKEKGEKKE
ncbi:MAG: hypothetical protein KAY37_10625 [Phycisphaerae bacterium]|nr:hypothetical protein [Phycisphaerae bacterium]